MNYTKKKWLVFGVIQISFQLEAQWIRLQGLTWSLAQIWIPNHERELQSQKVEIRMGLDEIGELLSKENPKKDKSTYEIIQNVLDITCVCCELFLLAY